MIRPSSCPFATLLLLSALLSPAVECLAQNDWAGYYPLHQGNLWEYKEYLDSPPYPPVTVTREVMGDTLATNGHAYKIIRVRVWDGPFPRTSYEYERIDTSGNVFGLIELDCVFPSVWVDTLILKLNGTEGDTIPAPCRGGLTYWTLTARDSGMFFGERELVRFDLVNDVVRGVKVTASELGVVQEGFEGGDLILEGAVINGMTFGQITVSVEPHGNRAISDLNIRAFPNPFNGKVSIEYSLDRSEALEVSIYDLLGRRVTILSNGAQLSGYHTVEWSAKDEAGYQVASGTYLAVFRTEAHVRVCMLVLTK